MLEARRRRDDAAPHARVPPAREVVGVVLPGTRRGVELLEMLGRIPRTMSNTCPWAAATFMCVLRIWVQISENFKMKAENTAKIPKFSILAF